MLVGAGTARAEGYVPLRARPAFVERRFAARQRPVPLMAVVTRSGDLTGAEALLGAGAGTLVVTCERGPVETLRAAVGPDRVIVAGGGDVDLCAAVAALAGRGLRRVLLEGGPRLLGAVAAVGRLDELCLTWSPLVVGGGGPRITSGPAAALRLRPAHLIAVDDLLLGRWLVLPDRSGTAPPAGPLRNSA